ncbi:Hsp20/alpha crystallin family protein [Balneola vulgaris]|uniref:Hsp20/alpha crystallin family protein n=1 Tax=Balneola vulgaris TaxID=287535 RepID=UPI0003800965|nr:Hsp20/alpha crystallin family protein [Balneola vulgaris]
MALIKYQRPNTDLFSKNFNDIVDEMFNGSLNYKSDSFMPNVDVAENDASFEISAELPGIKKDDINIELDNGRLTISGERKFQNEENAKNYHRVETKYGKFSRSFYLPDSINEESINAQYEDGLLNITIEKKEEKVKKKIQIN